MPDQKPQPDTPPKFLFCTTHPRGLEFPIGTGHPPLLSSLILHPGHPNDPENPHFLGRLALIQTIATTSNGNPVLTAIFHLIR